MTTDKIRDAVQSMKSAGASKLPLPLNVVLDLVKDAEAYRRLPQLAKDAVKEMMG